MLQRGLAGATPNHDHFEAWKASVLSSTSSTSHSTTPNLPHRGRPVGYHGHDELPLYGAIEEQLPSFLYPADTSSFAAFPTQATQFEVPPEPAPLNIEPPTRPVHPPRAISAWSTPLTSRGPPSDTTTVRPARKKISPGKQIPIPALQPIYVGEWTVSQPSTLPAIRGRGETKVVPGSREAEAARQAQRQEAAERQAAISAGGEDPFGGW